MELKSNRCNDVGKVAIVAGFGDVGKGSARSLRQAGARVMVQRPTLYVPTGEEGYKLFDGRSN